MLSRLLIAIALALAPSLALAQGTVLQGGPWTPGHVPMYVGQGSSQPVVQDSGPAGGGALGLGLSEINITARGTGTAPYSGQGTGPYGTTNCTQDAPTTNPTGYHYLCFSANGTGNTGIIAYGAAGAASNLPLTLYLNGSAYTFPFAIGGIVGPSTTVINDIAVWNNTTGTLLKDVPFASICAVFSSGTAGCVPASGGGTTNFLRADGTFASPPCALFASGSAGCVPASGGGTANFLRADGAWSSATLANSGVTPGSYGSASQCPTFTVTATGILTAASQTACGSGTITPYSINNICYVDGVHYTSLANALATCSSNSTVIVPSAQSITGSITIAGSYVKIRCENGAVLTYSVNVAIAFSGTNSGMEDCNLVGQGTTTPTAPPIVFANQFAYFRRNTVTGFGYTTEAGILAANGASNISFMEVTGNQIYNNKDFAINFSVSGAQKSIRITNNYLGNGVWMIPQVGGTTPNDWVISGNELDAASAGLTATSASCMQLLGGHVTIVNAVITGNNCHLEGNLATGTGQEGFGMGGMNKFTFTSNTFDARGFTVGGAYSFEFNGMTNGTISSNSGVAIDGAAGFICENCRFVAFTGNIQTGWGTSSASSGFAFVTNATSAIMQALTITGNTAAFSNGGAGQGIIVSCANTSATCTDYVITGNSIVSDGTALSIGVDLVKTLGTMADIQVGPNEIRSPATGVQLSSGITSYCLTVGANYASTAVTDGSGGSACH